MATAAQLKEQGWPRVQRPSLAELKAKLATVTAAIKAAAQATETACRVPAENIAALRAIGYFDIVKPAMFGGYEHDFDVLVALNIELAKHCASTAWVGGLLAAHQWLIASFPEEAQRDVWGENPDALACGSYAPAAKALSVDGGYRLSGRWSFASGCDNAQWSLCAALLPSAAAANQLTPAFLLVPASDYVIDNTWNVVGLAGTGSKTLVLDNVFVPTHRVLRFAETTSGQTPGAALYVENTGFSVPMLCNIPSCLASTAVGAAAGALEDYLDRTAKRVTRGAVAGSNNKMAEFPTIQLRVAEAAASVDAAREVLLRDLRDRVASLRAGQPVTVEDRITSRRGQAFAVSLAIRAAEALNASTGGLGLDLSNPVQRAWRDANAVGRHISMNWDAVGTMYGQMALGLPPQGQY
ncbi:flavin-dependent monooxygenase [Bradyrhizobium sp. CCGUVB1N3]|uniref:acyl-CoA dehydrogenase family protein n=1 Tax=Bradyrhizobium sp. CCGUVB1N3 TaxID=2949629 RepID=UPI0020B20B9E|nr:acyl-CoA dehydrogenase family protein [Bradyrhizobium sp. CCGUVB1N3]MCP3471535.1 flavin-dependent monooxygenase [Bradyrhizobium sp. CCGUVB1N3]